MSEHRSKERVVRDDVLVYAEGDLIPETDTEELERQGLVARKAKAPAANKAAAKPAANK